MGSTCGAEARPTTTQGQGPDKRGSPRGWGAEAPRALPTTRGATPSGEAPKTPGERLAVWLDRRERRCSEALRSALGLEGQLQLPRVGLAVSGGGHRAMLTFAAAMDVLQSETHKGISVIDTVLTIGATSGGAWGATLWLAAEGRHTATDPFHGVKRDAGFHEDTHRLERFRDMFGSQGWLSWFKSQRAAVAAGALKRDSMGAWQGFLKRTLLMKGFP
eukprot:Hpha_TRINITY_DN28395_c0_g1::TRINITY_DN28395_c0_g1_i1::g.2238::m.2238